MQISRGQKISIAVLIFLILIHTANINNKITFDDKTLTVGFFVDGDYRIYDSVDKIAAKTGMEISYTSGIMHDDYSEWLAARFVDGNEPDVFLLFASDLPLYTRIGALADLPEDMFVPVSYETLPVTNDVVNNDVKASPLNQNKIKGKIYAVPFVNNYTNTTNKQHEQILIGMSSRTDNRELALKFLNELLLVNLKQ